MKRLIGLELAKRSVDGWPILALDVSSRMAWLKPQLAGICRAVAAASAQPASGGYSLNANTEL
jgi:hypothetical protein